MFIARTKHVLRICRDSTYLFSSAIVSTKIYAYARTKRSDFFEKSMPRAVKNLQILTFSSVLRVPVLSALRALLARTYLLSSLVIHY